MHIVKLKNLFGPVLGLSLLSYLLVHFDFAQILDTLLSAKIEFVFLSALMLLLSTLLGCLNLFLLFPKEDRPIGFLKFLQLYWYSWAFALVVPAQVGDVASMTVLLKKHSVKLDRSLGLMLIDKIASLVIMLGISLLSYFYIKEYLSFDLSSFYDNLSLLLLLLGLISILSLVLYYCFKRTAVKLLEFIKSVFKEIQTVCGKYPKKVLRNLIITIFKVYLVGLAYFFMFKALSVDSLAVLETTSIAIASGLIAYLPISFNGLGTVELTGVLLFSLLGIAEPIILSSYILLRLLGLTLSWIPVSIMYLKK